MFKSIKLFLFGILFFVSFSFLPCFAEETLNSISDITVRTDGVNFIFTLDFKNKYKDSVYVQKQRNGYFHIFIPDTTYDADKTNIKFKLPKKMYKPEIDIEQRKYIKDKGESQYIKIDVFTDEGADVTAVAEQYGAKIFKNILKTVFLLLLFAICGAGGYFLHKNLPYILAKRQYTTFIPETMADNSSKGYKTYKKNKLSETPYSGESLFESLLISDLADFRCFEVNDKTSSNDKLSNIKSAVPNGKNISFADKFTNPLVTDFGADINIKEDKKQVNKKKEKEEEIETPKDELITLLNITPACGFALKREKGKYNLYSFNGPVQNLLRTFTGTIKNNLQARHYDRSDKGDIYLVMIDNYKSLIEFSENAVTEITVLQK